LARLLLLYQKQISQLKEPATRRKERKCDLRQAMSQIGVYFENCVEREEKNNEKICPLVVHRVFFAVYIPLLYQFPKFHHPKIVSYPIYGLVGLAVGGDGVLPYVLSIQKCVGKLRRPGRSTAERGGKINECTFDF